MADGKITITADNQAGPVLGDVSAGVAGVGDSVESFGTRVTEWIENPIESAKGAVSSFRRGPGADGRRPRRGRAWRLWAPRCSRSPKTPATVKAISGHSSTRMLERYTHPTEEWKIGALDLPCVGTKWAQHDTAVDQKDATAREIEKLLKESGGRHEARTRGLRVANAALSQLS
jgi:hypothetical protein